MIIPKDIYLHIAQFADDITGIRMLSVNREFNNKFRQVFHKKYPLLDNFHLQNEDWRKYYKIQIAYIYKLKRRGIPYMPLKKFNPEQAFHANRFRISVFAAENGNLDIITRQFHLFDSNNYLLSIACKFGHLSIVRFLCENLKEFGEFIDFDLAIDKSRKRNQTHIIENLEHFRDFGKFPN